MRSRPRSPLAIVAFVATVLLLAGPVASAAPAELALRTDADLVLDGEAEVCIEEGAAMIRSFHARGTWLLEVGDAALDLVEARRPAVTVDGTQFGAKTPPEHRVYPVDAGAVVLTADNEYLSLVLEPKGGRVCAGGHSVREGRPIRLEQDVDRDVPPAPPSSRWSRGWWFVGSYPAAQEIEGYPTLIGTRLTVEGDVHVTASGGNITFRSDGKNVTERLGNYYEPGESATVSTVSAGTQIARAVELSGPLGPSELAITDAWGLASPSMDWSFSGDIGWPHANGTATFGGARHSFDDATVQAQGSMRIAFSETSPLGDVFDYRAQGDLETLAIDGAVLEATAVVPAAPVTSAGFVALLLAGAAWVFREAITRAVFAAYTRLTPADALNHPTRALILERVRATPGMHASELHRVVGGAWGPFRFHLRVLESFGAVRLERQGKYAVVLPTVVDNAIAVIPHETQRRVFEALPADGAPVSVRELSSITGLTRQLVNYHLGALSRAGLVARAGTALGPRLVRRQLSPMEPQRARR